MKKLYLTLLFVYSTLLNSQTITECDERVRTYIDSDGKPYMCVIDGQRDFLFIKKLRQDTVFYECVIFHKDSVKVEQDNGIVFFLSNNTRIAKLDAIISLEAFDENKKIYIYTSTVSITKEDIDRLLTYSITSVTLNKMYRVVEDGEDYKSDLFCLIVK